MPSRVRLLPRLQALASQTLASRLGPLAFSRKMYLGKPIVPQRLEVPTRHGPMLCLAYVPSGEGPYPTVVNIHGGAFYLQLPEQDGHINSYLASLGLLTISPDYSVGPQAQYPTAEEECFDVLRWLLAGGAEQLGADPKRMALAGTSAGGKLAMNMLQMLGCSAEEGRIKALALICAVADVTRTDRRSPHPERKPRPIVSMGMQRLARDTYFPDAACQAQALASPLYDPLLGPLLPPTLVLTGELDPLGPEMDTLAQRWKRQGAKVLHHRYPNADHGFAHTGPLSTTYDAMQRVGGFLRAHLLPPSA